jgi:hypothetical protein
VEEEKKSVLGSDSFEKEPEAEVPSEEPVVAHNANAESCEHCAKMLEDPAVYLKELIEAQELETQESEEIEVSEKSQTFSEQVKDVLAALNDLMVRATAIAMLRAKDGRTLGVKATEALRAVQEDLSDAWVELDQFIENVGTEVVTELEVEEQQPVEDVIEDEDPSDDIEVEEVESSEEPEVELPEAVTDDNSESSDEDFDAEWLEGQSLLSDTVDIDISEEDEPVL